MLAWVWLACGGDDGTDGEPLGPIDRDEDGVVESQDCDDDDRLVYPGAADTPYDGVDSDCAGDDDFDADGDGVRGPEGDGTDCNDANDDVSPTLDEVPYDALDNDCDPATPNDDVDGDGFRAFEECDDADSSAFPGAIEVAFDGVDQDCDGTVDAAAFGTTTWSFAAPGSLRAIDTRDAVAVLFVADRAVRPPPASTLDTVAVSLAIGHDLRGGAALTEPPNLVWGQGDDHPIRALALTTRGDEVVVGLSWTSVGRMGFLGLVPLAWSRGVGWFPQSPSYSDELFQDHTSVDAWTDGGDAIVAGSGAAGVGWAVAGDVLAEGGLATDGVGGLATFRDPGAPGTFVACEADCTSWVLDPAVPGPPTLAPAQPWAGRSVTMARTHGGGVVWWESARGVHWTDATADVELGAGRRVADADVIRDGGDLFALLLSEGELQLVRGPVGGPFDEVAVPAIDVDGRRFDPDGVALEVRDDALFLVVVARDDSGATDADRIAWTVLAR